MTQNSIQPGLLGRLRVLEIGHFVAAPFCTRLLADLGADVIKIEPPTGDPVRHWGAALNGQSLWWSMHGRNKKSLVLDLKKAEARAIVIDLVARCDVLVENFRPGHLDRLGLDAATLRRARPDLIIARISGYGQSGPGKDRSSFGMIGEAVGGLRYLTNHAPGVTDLPPVRVGVSIGDSIAGLYAAFGIMSALWERDAGDGRGRTIDVALSEAVLSMMEGMLPEYGATGRVKQPTGGGIATAAPTNAYRSADSEWILIGANSDPLFAKLAGLMGRSGLADDPRYSGNRSRVAHATELDEMIAAWAAEHSADALVDLLESADIPHTKVYTAADCAGDEQFRARGMVREVNDPAFDRPILHAGVVPHIEETPGTVRWAGPVVGQHSADILRDLLGRTPDQIAALEREGVI